MVPDPSLTPDLIQARTFTQGFRGYEHSEVRDFLTRIATEVRALRERAEQLESAWRSAEERAARPPVLDEDTLMAAVGEETASILRSARAAASDMRARAGEDSERLVSGAREEADRIRAEAETVLADERKNAEETAAGIVEAAREESAQMLESVRAEAETIRAKAEQDRSLTIEGANTTRERILEDLSRRRRVATVQIEQLRAGRERLLEAYAVVRRTLEEAQEDLTRADAEARAAADDTGRRLRAEDDLHAHEADLQAREALDESEDSHDHGDSDDGALVEAVAHDTPAKGSPVEQLFARIRGSEALAPVEAPEPAHAEPEANAEPEGQGDAATEADTDAVADPTIQIEAEAEVADTNRVNGSESWLQRREVQLVDLETGLTRKLKRALQDEQNDILDRLRGLRGEPTAAALLPPLDEHAARYAKASLPLVERAASAGAAFAGDVLGSAPAGRPAEVEDLAGEAASTIVGPLRRRLEHLISSAAGEEQSVLVESLGAAYREWKSHRIERVAGDVLAAAFSRGTWNATPDGTSFRWIVEDVDGPCPDCDDDALAGDLPKGEPFPTGQPHPPAHSGCRCLLVPVSG
ncbi:MAG TPA: DivIVA domain-containing protein [Acidimicrobiales bacterium]|nr:DivIVA domain-containing protein [Acidimicrobiales bacterium]